MEAFIWEMHWEMQSSGSIDWNLLSRNPNAIPILERNLDKVNWDWLSHNPNAIPLLEKNPDKINWSYLAENPGIFVYDYEAMRETNKSLKEELMQLVWHPSRVAARLDAGIDLEDM
jgi:hypothetical protein